VLAGDGPSLDHRLPLPHSRFVPVVAERRPQGSTQRTRTATGPKGGVDPQGDPLLGRLGEQGDQSFDRSRGVRRVVSVQEEQVDVARVVELSTAELAETDHRHAGDGADSIAHERQARVGHIADLRDDLVHESAAQIAGGDPEHRAPAKPAKALGCAQPIRVRDELRVKLPAVPA
jgi:hypothetical protein